MAAFVEQLVDGVRRFGQVVRWSEPWDVGDVDDRLYDDGPVLRERFDLWA